MNNFYSVVVNIFFAVFKNITSLNYYVIFKSWNIVFLWIVFIKNKFAYVVAVAYIAIGACESQNSAGVSSCDFSNVVTACYCACCFWRQVVNELLAKAYNFSNNSSCKRISVSEVCVRNCNFTCVHAACYMCVHHLHCNSASPCRTKITKLPCCGCVIVVHVVCVACCYDDWRCVVAVCDSGVFNFCEHSSHILCWFGCLRVLYAL